MGDLTSLPVGRVGGHYDLSAEHLGQVSSTDLSAACTIHLYTWRT